jgi:hypothetical protein
MMKKLGVENKEARKEMWDQFGRGFKDSGEKMGAPKKIPSGDEKALDEVYKQAKSSQLCHKCLSHSFWSPENKARVTCPLDKLKDNDPVKKGWLEFFSALKPAADRLRALQNNRH